MEQFIARNVLRVHKRKYTAKQVKKEQRQVNKKFCELKKRKYRDC